MRARKLRVPKRIITKLYQIEKLGERISKIEKDIRDWGMEDFNIDIMDDFDEKGSMYELISDLALSIGEEDRGYCHDWIEGEFKERFYATYMKEVHEKEKQNYYYGVPYRHGFIKMEKLGKKRE